MTKDKKRDFKRFTVRIPFQLWRTLKNMAVDGEIKSLNHAVIESLERLIMEKERMKDINNLGKTIWED
jgi:predicted HicB family RNase H-like nuclease